MARILFVATWDWLFARRHLPAVRAARELDLSVTVAARLGQHGRQITAAGARTVELNIYADGFSPLALARSVRRLRALLATEKPDIVQFHGLRPLVAGAVAARLARIEQRIFAPGGLGAMARGDTAIAKASLMAMRNLLLPLAGEGAHLLFDNPDDAELLGLLPAEGASFVHMLPGPGVDPLIHSAEPMPWMPPLKLAFVSALLWANGPEIAVQAVTRARAAGAEVKLSLIGGPCLPGRAAVPEATLRGWSRMSGINWFAPSNDPAQVWRQHHALILPSRGGDGLPILLTEAASAGRLILTSDVGGCKSFVRDGIDGYVVPEGDVDALANLITRLSRAPGLVERLGRSARERVLDGYTERQVMEAYKKLWRGMLQSAAAA